MITSQMIKKCLDEMSGITHMGFSVQDLNGNSIAATDGMAIPDAEVVTVFARSAADSQIMGTSYLLKVLDESDPCYILTASGSREYALMAAKMVAVQLQNLISVCKERLDRNNFFQNLLLDNLLKVDIHNRARKLRITNTEHRAVIIFDIDPGKDGGCDAETAAVQLLTGLFASQGDSYLTEVEENSVILIKALTSEDDYETLEQCAVTAVDMLEAEAMVRASAAYGTIVTELKDLSKSYKEARMAMDVGRIFYAGRKILSYNELGIGRLIYQLPVNLCRMFLHEIFGDYDPSLIDQETLATIQTFFANNLNVSETSRKLFVHRNTLVYRMDKLQRTTGLDIRTFEDAMTFRIAIMVNEYMKFLERKD